MTFKKRVERTEAIRDAYCKGIQALKSADRDRIVVADSRRLSGSIDLDAATRASQPNAARWDYGIGWIGTSETVYWVEVHPASSGANFGEISGKLDWLLNWLSNEGCEFDGLRKYIVWIASGRSAFTRTSPQLRKLASRGLSFEGRQLRIG